MSPSLWALVTAVAGLIIAEFKGHRGARAIFKLSASSVFLWEGAQRGLAADDVGSLFIMAGLVGCFLGDAALLSRAKPAFLAGLGSFLLGHLLFAIGFGVRGPAWPVAGGTLVGLLLPAIIVHRWLMPHVEAGMRVPVLAYMAVITSMLALAVGLAAATTAWVLLGGAALFSGVTTCLYPLT
ncbi:MAG: lysoplasmalogenase family protein, partial [Nannocystaceae bacterium]